MCTCTCTYNLLHKPLLYTHYEVMLYMCTYKSLCFNDSGCGMKCLRLGQGTVYTCTCMYNYTCKYEKDYDHNSLLCTVQWQRLGIKPDTAYTCTCTYGRLQENAVGISVYIVHVHVYTCTC